jgi:glyoxylase-like metal-dependent hydrolase (beta-lactamase superfamily II)
MLVAAGLAACSRAPDTAKPAAPADTAATPAATTSTPAPAARSDAIHKFKIGDLSAVALRDGALEFPNDNQVFGVGHTPEEVASLLSAAGAPTDMLHVSLQPLLVEAPERVLLFDTGAGTNFGPSAGQLLTAMAAAGVDPKSVTDIFISHVHGDHVGGLVDAQGALVFPAATIHLSAPEWEFLKGMDAVTAKDVGIKQYDPFIAAITPKVAAFTPNSAIIPGLVEAHEIRGHTPGHSGYVITSGQSSLLYIGDAMHHYVLSVQKPDWPNGFDGDPATAAESRSTLVAESAANGQRLYAVHFPFPGLGKIEQRNGGFVWVPE